MRSYVMQHAITIGTALLVAGCVTNRTETEKAAVQANPLVKTSTTTLPAVTRVTVGKWKSSGPGQEAFVIYRKNSRMFLRRRNADGSTSTIRLKAFQHQLGRGYRPINSSGQYWIIDRDGDLQSWSKQQGYVGLARRG